MSLFAPILPSSVRVVERFGSVADRRAQFALGRELAAAALQDPAVVIPRGARGAPRWPAGVVGSITHTHGYAAVAVADRAGFASLGIDAEPVAAVPPEAVSVVATPAERADLSRVAGEHAALLAFVAKEAVFKAWWPLTARELDFAEVTLSVADEGGAERAADGVLSAVWTGTPWEVRWRMADALMLAAVAVPAR